MTASFLVGSQTASAQDYRYMALAIQLASKGRYTTSPNPRVGCVIVAPNNEIVGQGFHIQAGTPHAEVHALAQAKSHSQGATAYVTLEPCSHYGRTPPCAEALIKAKVARVVVAMTDPNPQVSGRGLKMLIDAGIAVTTQVMEQEAIALNRGFIKRMVQGQPWVTVKMASSLDGKVALQNGVSQWITGPAARKDVQRHRAASCVVLTGSGTAKYDNPSLLVRATEFDLTDYPLTELRQPERVVIDSKGVLSPTLKMFNDGHPVTLVSNQPPNQVFSQSVKHLALDSDEHAHISLSALLDELGRAGHNEVWVEAGSGLTGALLEQGLVDEVIVYQAAKIMGPDAQDMFLIDKRETMDSVLSLSLQSVVQVGQDIKMTYLTPHAYQHISQPE